MDLGLKGKRALVLGSSDGLGYAVAEELVKEGARVCALLAKRGTAREGRARDRGARPTSWPTFRSPVPGASRSKQAAKKLGGGVDILVTNTGGPPQGRVSLDDRRAVAGGISVALAERGRRDEGRAARDAGAALGSHPARHLGRGPRADGRARRSRTACARGCSASPRASRTKIAKDGVTINALLPGYTRTERMRQLGIDERKISAQIPAGRLGEPREFAALAAFLASERAAYVSGQMIAVDGGYLRGI